MALVLSREEADAAAAEMYVPVEGGEPLIESHIHFSDDVLDLLSLVSDSCADRVRVMLHLTAAEAEVRRAASRQRFRL